MPRIQGKTVLVTGGARLHRLPFDRPPAGGGGGEGRGGGQLLFGQDGKPGVRPHAFGDRLTIVRDDARQFGVMQAVIEREGIEVVFNLATLQLKYSFFNPIDAYQVNVDIMRTLLTLLKMGAFATLIHASTSEAYGTVVYEPMDENHPLYPTTPMQPERSPPT